MQTIKLKWGFMRFSIFLGIVFLTGGCAPAFDYHYFFSETEGVVLMAGKPVSDVKVSRWYRSNWYMNDTLESVNTDDKGYFHFAQGRKYAFIFFLHQPVIHQKLNFEYFGHQYLGWKYVRSSYAQDTEIGKPIKLKCDLSAKEGRHSILGKTSYGATYNGLCEISEKH